MSSRQQAHLKGLPKLRVWPIPLGVTWAAACAAAAPLGAVGQEVPGRFRGPVAAVVTPVGPAPSTRTLAHTYHVVERGETLWRISKLYGVELAVLAQANQLSDPTQVQAGTRLLVPQGVATKAPTDLAQVSGDDAASTPQVGDPVKPSSFAPASQPAGDELPPPPPPLDTQPQRGPGRKGRLEWPVEGVISSRFGKRDGKAHDGIDIRAAKGTPVQAADDGDVLFSDQHEGYGNLVVLRHNGGLITVYAHHEVNLVRKGQHVRRGQTIARVGETGRTSGPHLHFEVRRGPKPDNPLRYLPP